ncbi:MAG: carotenoid oxygenase family protein [Hymenobacter sp.]
MRFRLDLAAGTVTRQPLADCEGELPEIHPDRLGLPYRYTWTIGRPAASPSPLLDHLLKLDVQTGELRHASAPGTLCSEPVVVPRPSSTAEDDGYLVYLRYSAPDDATDLLVAGAADLRPLARLRLPHHIPAGLSRPVDGEG